MTDSYLGQILQGGWNFAPRGTAACAGQLIPIQQNTALFSLLGTTYGGNGTTTFALPDLRGRVAVNNGQGPGLPQYDLGQTGGAFQVTLNAQQMPIHTHVVQASTTKATTQVPAAGSMLAHADDTSGKGSTPAIYLPAASSTNAVSLGGVNTAGGSQPFSVLNPYLAITIVIATQGVFPSRN